MRHASTRPLLLSSLALGGALLWGLLECFALLWSRLSERLGIPGRIRAF
jgi:hypothetical protein